MEDTQTMNGQGVDIQNVVTIPTKANPEDSSTKDSKQPNPAAKDSKKDVSKPVEEKVVPYDRLMQVTEQNKKLLRTAETNRNKIRELETQIAETSKTKELTVEQKQQLVDEDFTPEEIALFGKEKAAEGRKILNTILEKKLATELAERQRLIDEAKTSEQKQAEVAVGWVEQEISTIKTLDPDLDENKFKKFVADDIEEKDPEKQYNFWRADNLLDLKKYYRIYSILNPKQAKTVNPDLEKIAGKTVNKTDAVKTFSAAEVRKRGFI